MSITLKTFNIVSVGFGAFLPIGAVLLSASDNEPFIEAVTSTHPGLPFALACITCFNFIFAQFLSPVDAGKPSFFRDANFGCLLSSTAIGVTALAF